MSIHWTCACGKTYRLDDSKIGKRVRCPACGATATVSQVEEPVATVAQSQATDPSPSAEDKRSLGDRMAESEWFLSSRASNPARVKLDENKYARIYRLRLTITLLIALAVPVIVWVLFSFTWWRWILAPVSFLIANFFRTTPADVKLQFFHGDTCPGVVIAQDPYRVAAYTDLTKGEGSHPAVKILQQPLQFHAGGPPQVGQRIPMAAFYRGRFSKTWSDFMPIAIGIGTDDVSIVRERLQSIAEQDWKALEKGLAQVGPNAPDGLYRIE